MDKFLPLLKQILSAAFAFLAYSMGARDKEMQQELAQKDAALTAANKALESGKKYEKIKQLAPDSWDSLRRMSDDTKNKVSTPAKTKLP